VCVLLIQWKNDGNVGSGRTRTRDQFWEEEIEPRNRRNTRSRNRAQEQREEKRREEKGREEQRRAEQRSGSCETQAPGERKKRERAAAAGARDLCPFLSLLFLPFPVGDRSIDRR
jgi:hypothetical protein